MVGLGFIAAFDRVNHKALIFKLRQLGAGGPFLSVLTGFLSNRLQRVSLMGIEMLFPVYRREVYLVLCFSYCIPMICGLG